MQFTNIPDTERNREQPDRPVCSEILIGDEWLAVCVLPPGHSDDGSTHLPSPYL